MSYKYPISHTCADQPELPCLACGAPQSEQQKQDRVIAREDLIRQAEEKMINALNDSPDSILKALRWFADQLEAL